MPIIVNLDVMLAKRKRRSKELAERIGITEQNVSLLKSGKVRGVRFETLEKICEVLDCQPGDILEYRTANAPRLAVGESRRERRSLRRPLIWRQIPPLLSTGARLTAIVHTARRFWRRWAEAAAVCGVRRGCRFSIP
jgi:putative transcriptional regulator